MPDIVTDSTIRELLAEPKLLPEKYQERLRLSPKRGHRELELKVKGQAGGDFRVILRQSTSNPMDFSVILAWLPPQSTSLFRLRRYNGRSHEHTNSIETETFYGFHIHQATQRYQEMGLKEDFYADRSDRYQDMQSAIGCMMEDCGFTVPQEQLDLFKEGMLDEP